MKKLVWCFLFSVFMRPALAQELNCTVNVLTPQIQASDKTIYETLKTAIRDFMNNRQWTTRGRITGVCTRIQRVSFPATER